MPNKPLPLWIRLVRETLWGTRSIWKIGGMGLPLAGILSSLPQIPDGVHIDSMILFCMAACFVLVGMFSNDLADRKIDMAEGKQRWIQKISFSAGLLVIFIVAAFGASLAFFSSRPFAVAAVYLSAVALAIAYSCQPFRLKEHGILGFISFSACITICYVGLPWAWFGGDWNAPLITGTALFLDRWVNLHFHQIVDYESDYKQGQKTFAVGVGVDKARKTLFLFVAAAVVSMLFVIGWLITAIGSNLVASFILVCAFSAAVYGKYAGKAAQLLGELPVSYLALTFALLRFGPPLLFARLAVRTQSLWIPAIFTGALLLHDTLVFRKYRYS